MTDPAGQPLVAADVSLPALSKATATDATGAFRIEGIPAGMQHAVVRRAGYRAIDTSLTFSGDRTVHRPFELVRAVTLDSVVVTESAVDKRMESFEDNRRLGLGHFFTYEQLSQREGQSTGTIFIRSAWGGGPWKRPARLGPLIAQPGTFRHINVTRQVRPDERSDASAVLRSGRHRQQAGLSEFALWIAAAT